MSIVLKDLKGVDGVQILGIKKAPSKDGSKVYTTYYAAAPWSDYELGRSDYLLDGIPVCEFQTTKDFPIAVGNVVKFYYGRAIGNYQPIDDYKLISEK